MKTLYQSWLEQRGCRPGVLVCGICLPDKTHLSRSGGDSFPLDNIEKIFQQLAEFLRSLGQSQLGATRLRWSFAHGQLHWAVRPDNVSLFLFMPGDPSTSDRSQTDLVIDEFLGLEER